MVYRIQPIKLFSSYLFCFSDLFLFIFMHLCPVFKCAAIAVVLCHVACAVSLKNKAINPPPHSLFTAPQVSELLAVVSLDQNVNPAVEHWRTFFFF